MARRYAKFERDRVLNSTPKKTKEKPPKRGKSTLWMAVTNNELELPVYVADTIMGLADMMGMHRSAIHHAVVRDSAIDKSKYRIVKVILDDDIRDMEDYGWKFQR